MRLVMTLLVRNEEDIVRANIDYHLARGVDFIIATDNGSVDGTRDLLEEYRRSGVLRVLHEPTDDYSQWRWVTRMARLAHDEHEADWVINSDADEFWWPLAGDLKDALRSIEPDAGALLAPRSNFVPRPHTNAPFFERMILRERFSLNSVGAPLLPKMCHRAAPNVEVAQGNHSVASAEVGAVSERRPILILHFPVRSYAQLERKIEAGGAAYERNTELPHRVGVTWRMLYAELRGGRLRDYYESQVLPDDVVTALVRSGQLIQDTRLRDFLLARRCAQDGDRR